MKTTSKSFVDHAISAFQMSLLALFTFSSLSSLTQSLTTEFVNAGYVLTDLGSVDQLPSRYGGLTIRPEQPNTLYIGGYANEGLGALYTVGLVRDPVTHHITGFDGAATLYAAAPNIDGGVFFAPNGTLLFTQIRQLAWLKRILKRGLQAEV